MAFAGGGLWPGPIIPRQRAGTGSAAHSVRSPPIRSPQPPESLAPVQSPPPGNGLWSGPISPQPRGRTASPQQHGGTASPPFSVRSPPPIQLPAPLHSPRPSQSLAPVPSPQPGHGLWSGPVSPPQRGRATSPPFTVRSPPLIELPSPMQSPQSSQSLAPMQTPQLSIGLWQGPVLDRQRCGTMTSVRSPASTRSPVSMQPPQPTLYRRVDDPSRTIATNPFHDHDQDSVSAMADLDPRARPASIDTPQSARLSMQYSNAHLDVNTAAWNPSIVGLGEHCRICDRPCVSCKVWIIWTLAFLYTITIIVLYALPYNGLRYPKPLAHLPRSWEMPPDVFAIQLLIILTFWLYVLAGRPGTNRAYWRCTSHTQLPDRRLLRFSRFAAERQHRLFDSPSKTRVLSLLIYFIALVSFGIILTALDDPGQYKRGTSRATRIKLEKPEGMFRWRTIFRLTGLNIFVTCGAYLWSKGGFNASLLTRREQHKQIPAKVAYKRFVAWGLAMPWIMSAIALDLAAIAVVGLCLRFNMYEWYEPEIHQTNDVYALSGELILASMLLYTELFLFTMSWPYHWYRLRHPARTAAIPLQPHLRGGSRIVLRVPSGGFENKKWEHCLFKVWCWGLPALVLALGALTVTPILWIVLPKKGGPRLHRRAFLIFMVGGSIIAGLWALTVSAWAVLRHYGRRRPAVGAVRVMSQWKA